MRKLLFFIDTGLNGGGAERVLCNLVNSLDPARWEVTVMTLWPQDPAPWLLPHVHYRSLYPRHDRLTHMLYRLEAALGIACRRIPARYDIAAAYLEGGSTKVLAPFARAAKKLAWVHSDFLRRDDLDQLRKAAAWYRRYDRVVCVSGSVADSFRRVFPDAPPTAVLYNINNEAEIQTRAAAFAPDPADIPTLCAVGRLSAEKGFDHLIRSCARLKEEGIPFRLQIIGEGEARPMLEELIAGTGMTDRVALPGWQSNPYPYMKAADLIVCSSLYEGLSTVITESLILGKAIVTTPCAGMAELLGDSEHGLIADGSSDGLYRALRRMLTEPQLRQQYAAAAERRGRDLRRSELVRKTEAFFTELMEGTRSE